MKKINNAQDLRKSFKYLKENGIWNELYKIQKINEDAVAEFYRNKTEYAIEKYKEAKTIEKEMLRKSDFFLAYMIDMLNDYEFSYTLEICSDFKDNLDWLKNHDMINDEQFEYAYKIVDIYRDYILELEEEY